MAALDPSRSRRGAIVAACLLVAAGSIAGCASDDGPSARADAATTTTTRTSTTTTTSARATEASRPEGPAADLDEELTGGDGVFLGAAAAAEVPAGYVEHEYVASGTATGYRAQGALTEDGHWHFEPDTEAAYRTRVVVRRPADAARASGTVVVEWLNVSGGVDANPDWSSLAEEITRQGHTWVGVSAQLIGVEGGPVLVAPPGVESIVGKGLVALDPARYGTLDHPGDGYSFDIFTQVARALRAGGPALGGVRPRILLAVGESQSALALTTYYDGVQPLTGAFDGFLIHSRAFAGLPLVAPGQYADLAGSFADPTPVVLRDDLDAPVLELQAEGDVVGVLDSLRARQPDTDRFRLWEVAGTAHADVHLIGSLASKLDCGVAINDGPMHVVAKAALRALDHWVATGDGPPHAPRLQVTEGDEPAIARDPDGIALGGIRTPPVDVPVDVLSGSPGTDPSLLCLLFGSTTPLPPERIAQRYPSRAAYLEQYAAAADQAEAQGFVLADDRAALDAYARPDRVS